MYKISTRQGLQTGGGPYSVPAGSNGQMGIKRFNSCATDISLRDLLAHGVSGLWLGADEATYCFRQEGQRIWFSSMSNEEGLQQGLQYCSVFSGTIEGSSITGDWVDVPRGLNSNSGSLVISLQYDANGTVIDLTVTNAQGAFYLSKWNGKIGWTYPAGYPSSIPTTFEAIFKQVNKCTYDWFWENGGLDERRETLYDRLLVVSNHIAVIFGRLLSSNYPATPIAPDAFDCSFPYDNPDRSINSFWNLSDDGDCDTNIFANQNEFPAYLFDDVSQDDMDAINNWIVVTENQPTLLEPNPLYGGGAPAVNSLLIHPEIIMYGCADQAPDYPPLLPGWGTKDGYDQTCVLVNGRKIDGDLWINSQQGVQQIGGIDVSIGQGVRFSGILSNDYKHNGGINGTTNPLEIHPVFSVDVITTTGGNDISGTWGTSDGGTCYVRQTGNTVWFFLMRPIFDNASATVFLGTVQNDTITGRWADTTYGIRRCSGEISFLLSNNNQWCYPQGNSVLGNTTWRKLYD